MGKSLSSKYAKKSTTDAIKTARAIQKTTEATVDLIGNEIADKITNVSKKKPDKDLHNNDDETKDVEIATSKKRYIYPEEREQIIEVKVIT